VGMGGKKGVADADDRPGRRPAGDRAAQPSRGGRAALAAPSGVSPGAVGVASGDGVQSYERGSALTAAPVEGKLRRPDYRAR